MILILSFTFDFKMRGTTQYIAKGLWIISLILLCVFMTKHLIAPSPLRPLKGAVKKTDFPELTLNNWFNGKYQKKFNKAITRNFGFHSIFIRAHNQWNFSIWRKPRVNKVSIGQDGYLFEQSYIDGLLGTDLKKRTDIFNKNKDNFTKAIEGLKNDGQEVVFMIMPGKSFVHPDKIPEHKESIPKENTYTLFRDWADSSQLKIIDFHKYFVNNEANIKYPIFPKLGIHLSRYAESFVLDSLLHYVEVQSGKNLYDYHFRDVRLSDHAEGRDQDIGNAMNLMFPLEKETFAYRDIKVDSIYNNNPKVLVIGDSFYWGLYPIVLNNNFFPHHEFWYRNLNAFPAQHRPEQKESKSERAIRCIDTFDYTFILVTSIGLEKAGWGYFEALANHYSQ